MKGESKAKLLAKFAWPSRILSSWNKDTKKARAEANGKQSFQHLTMPNRSLSYEKIVKGERKAKLLAKFAWPSRILSSWNKDTKKARAEANGKQSFQHLTMPSRILSYEKIVKGESKAKLLAKFAWPSRLLFSWNKDSERKRLKQTEITVFICLGSSLSLSLNTRLRLPAKGTAAQRVTISYTLLIYLKTYTQLSRHEATFDLS